MFFVIACSFLVTAICSGFWYSLRLFVSFVTHLVLCYFIHCRSFASFVIVFVFLFFSQVCIVCRRVFSSSPWEFSVSIVLSFSCYFFWSDYFVLYFILSFVFIFYIAFIVFSCCLFCIAPFVFFSHRYLVI